MFSQSCSVQNKPTHIIIGLLLTTLVAATISGCCKGDEFKLQPLKTVPAVALNGSGEGYTAWAEGGGAVYIRRTLADGTIESPIEVSPKILGASGYCLQTSQPQITSNGQTTVVSWVSFDPSANYNLFGINYNNAADVLLLVSVITNGVPSPPVEMARRPDEYTCAAPREEPSSSGFLTVFGHKAAINDNGSAMLVWADGTYVSRFYNGTEWESKQALEVRGRQFDVQAGSSDFLIGTKIYDSSGTLKPRAELVPNHRSQKWFMNKANDQFLVWPGYVDGDVTLNLQKYYSNSDSWGAPQTIDSYPGSEELSGSEYVRQTRFSLAFDSLGAGLVLWQKLQNSADSTYSLVECTVDGNCSVDESLITDHSDDLSPVVNISEDGQAASILYVSNTTERIGTSAVLKTLKLLTAFGTPLSFTEETLSEAYVITMNETSTGYDVEGSNYPGRIENSDGDTIDVGRVPVSTFFREGPSKTYLKDSIALDNSHTTLLSWASPIFYSYAVTIQQAVYRANSASLTVSKTGFGQGQVRSDIAGIDCGSDCAEFFPLTTQVVLTARADVDSQFVRWSGTGDCMTPDGNTQIVVTLTQNSNCVATFQPTTPADDVTLTVVILGGPGAGEVNSLEFPLPIMQCLNSADASTTCSAQYPSGALVLLEPLPFFPNDGVEWTGCDRIGEAGYCELTLTADRTVTATFSEQSGTIYSISASSSDATKGDVVSVAPSGITGSINCPSVNCADLFTVTTSGSITLEARPKPGSIFASWGAGQCDSESRVNGVGICTMNLIDGSPMTTTRRADAQFF